MSEEYTLPLDELLKQDSQEKQRCNCSRPLAARLRECVFVLAEIAFFSHYTYTDNRLAAVSMATIDPSSCAALMDVENSG